MDKERKGFILASLFTSFVDKLHPYEKQRAKRALKGLNFEPTQKLTYKDVKRINDENPALFYPAYQFQDTLRKKTLGVDWWFKKLTMYSQVRQKMLKESENTAEIMEIELERFQNEELKKERMQKRDQDIKAEASQVRKALLQAKQFLDEVS